MSAAEHRVQRTTGRDETGRELTDSVSPEFLPSDSTVSRADRHVQGHNPTVVCCACDKVVRQGDPGLVSHGICRTDWHLFRAANGLKPKPYPEASK